MHAYIEVKNKSNTFLIENYCAGKDCELIKWPWYLLPTNHAYTTTGNKSEHANDFFCDFKIN